MFRGYGDFPSIPGIQKPEIPGYVTSETCFADRASAVERTKSESIWRVALPVSVGMLVIGAVMGRVLFKR